MRIATLALLVVSHTAWADEPTPPPADPVPAPTEEPAPAPTPPAAAPAPAPAPKPQPIDIELKPKAAHVLGEIPRPTQGRFATRERDVSHVPAYVATAVTGSLILATALSYRHHSALVDEIDKDVYSPAGAAIDDEIARRQKRLDNADRWHSIWLGSAVLTVIAGGATGFLWSRHETQPGGPVDPSNPGFIWPILNHPLLQRAPTVNLDVAPDAVRVAISQQF